MSDLPASISLREVGPRDGLQNEAPVPTDAKIELIDALSRTGVRRIEAEVHVSNEPSRRIVEKLGFIPDTGDSDGYLRYRLSVST